jgi:hypothetical protein
MEYIKTFEARNHSLLQDKHITLDIIQINHGATRTKLTNICIQNLAPVGKANKFSSIQNITFSVHSPNYIILYF